jgi:hypothetical protein
MTQVFLNSLAIDTSTNFWLIRSWFDKGFFSDVKTW